MQKGLGIAALVLSIIAMFVPFLGSWLTILVAVFAAFAYGPGLALAIAGIVIDLIHLFLFSPLLWATGGVAAIAGGEGSRTFMALPWILIAIQAAALLFLFIMNGKQKATAA